MTDCIILGIETECAIKILGNKLEEVVHKNIIFSELEKSAYFSCLNIQTREKIL
jgi:hypothetical protein